LRLNFQHITKNLGGQPVLNGVHAQFGPLRSLVLIGPSGGGKSTLLRLVAGLITPDSGSVSLDDQPLPTDEAGLRVHRSHLGVVFQSFNLFPHLTALQNLTLPLEKVHGLPPHTARETALHTLDRFQLGPHASKKPGALSGGQKQRVAIARAVACKPRMLLLDEPTSALDPEMTAEVLDLIIQLRAEGSRFLLVTHAMGFARRVADEVAFLAGGKIIEHGPADALFSQPQTPACHEFLARVLRY
jgi:polar amino acid transport system ATP-binding protein